MDILNDYLQFPENPDHSSGSEAEENYKNVEKLDKINTNRKRKKNLTFDDFCTKYSDEMWYIWCIINEYSKSSGLFDQLDYASFCALCYENSTKF